MRPGPTRDAFETATLTAEFARRTGAPIDEATDIVAEGLSRRRLLQGMGIVAAAAAVPIAATQPAVARSTVTGAKTGPKVVIIGAGIAGLGAALRLHEHYGIHAEVFEFNDVPGGRIRTLRGHFADSQIVEEHAEFINPEHTKTLALAKRFGLSLDNTDHYRSSDADQLTLRFNGSEWDQTRLNADWHKFGWKLFHDEALKAPFPTLYTHSTKHGRRLDRMSVAEWVAHTFGDDTTAGDQATFGQFCLSAVLDEYGGPPEAQSALNLIYLLGGDASTKSGNQPRSAPVPAGGDERWHISGGNDQLIDGILKRLPAGTVRYGQRLVGVRSRGHGRYAVVIEQDNARRAIVADHVILALPFTTLRDVELDRADIGALHRRAIQQMPLGSNAKFFLQYDNRTWVSDNDTGNAYCRGIAQGTWDATGYQPGDAGILAALPGGAVGAGWGSTYHLTTYRGTAPPAMVTAYLDEFEKLFPGSKQHYNGKSFYVWSSGDPHILGAYSYLKRGQYSGFNGIQGRREGNLHFAGEHTSINYQGYIEGALRSGLRCADEAAGKR